MSNMLRYFITILAKAVLFELCGADGTVSLKLTHYNHLDGMLEDGTCCDSHAFIASFCSVNPCDPYFILCLDEPNGHPRDISTCGVGGYDTGSISDKNDITFGESIWDGPNPKDLNFQIWEGGTLLKIKVMDIDPDNEDDLLEFLSLQVQMQASPSKADLRWNDFQLKGQQIQLDVQMAVYCHDNWFGPRCACKPSAHCNCSSDGNKHCECSDHNKWGSNCEQTCNCKDAVACNFYTGKCPNDECAPGWNGSNCNEKCTAEKWGTNCSQTCNCDNGVKCDAETGRCSNDECAPGWKGDACNEQCTEIGTWGRNCRKVCGCKDGVGCNITTGKCPNDECAPGWLGTCNGACGLPYYQSCDLKHSTPREEDIIGNHIVQSSAICYGLCDTNKKNGCIALDIIHQSDGSLMCKLMRCKGKSNCLTYPKVKHYVRDFFPKTCFINGTLPDKCEGEYKFRSLCDDEPVYEQTTGEHIIYHVRHGKKWVCTSVDSDMSECNGPVEAETPGNRVTMAGSWGSDSYAICQ